MNLWSLFSTALDFISFLLILLPKNSIIIRNRPRRKQISQTIELAGVYNLLKNRTHFFLSSFIILICRVMDDFKRRRNQIPEFGNWDYISDATTGTPITQCFESVRYSCVAGDDRDLYGAGSHDFLYSNHIPPHTYHHPLIKPPPPSSTVDSRRKMKGGMPKEKRYHNNNNKNMKDQKIPCKVHDATKPPAEHRHHHSSKIPNEVERSHNYDHQHYIPPYPLRIPPKAVDEDLYKIPPELLYKPKRKKIFGFFSCLVPTCAAA